MKTLYARAIRLRNCGRFTHVSSDFGSQYRTHTFVTSEALYASLTREVTWRHPGKFVDLEEDAQKAVSADYFISDYDVAQKPIWFTPGLFVDEQGEPLVRQPRVADKQSFNVIREGYPSTGGDGRPSYVPTYGSIESILPDQRLLTYVFSPNRAELEWFKPEQTFLLGKKRTMFQIFYLSDVVDEQPEFGYCDTPWLQLSFRGWLNFQNFTILVATMRYMILRGRLKEQTKYRSFVIGAQKINMPEFYINQWPIMLD